MTLDAYTPVVVTTESEILERRRRRQRALYSDLPRQAYSSFGFDPEMPDIPRGIDRAVAEVRIRDLVDELLESDGLLRPIIEMTDFRRDEAVTGMCDTGATFNHSGISKSFELAAEHLRAQLPETHPSLPLDDAATVASVSRLTGMLVLADALADDGFLPWAKQ
jgi:hypothetical protein